MKLWACAPCLVALAVAVLAQAPGPSGPLGRPGLVAEYQIEHPTPNKTSTVQSFALSLGPVEATAERSLQWLQLDARKVDGARYRVWILSDQYPAAEQSAAERGVRRYILQEGDTQPIEFYDRRQSQPVLPTLGGWPYLLPRTEGGSVAFDPPPGRVRLLGHDFRLSATNVQADSGPPRSVHLLNLRSEALIGVPSNTRQEDDTRRFDGSDYKLIRLSRPEIEAMIAAGINCFNTDAGQRRWVEQRDVYYWGGALADLPYPECLYRSSYLGPVLFLDEPAVGTRDYVIRPRLKEDPAFAHTLTPQVVLDAFEKQFHKAKYEGAPTELIRALAARADVDVGEMHFLQANLFTWETMISTATVQLREGAAPPPAAMVFEPPGHVGTRRTLPEFDMAYECQIPPTDPANLTRVLYGFLRGAARLSGRDWGTSIYGAVDPADSPWLLTSAYDRGARFFFFWDNSGLACVPFRECLSLARHLRDHIESGPPRDLPRLKRAAEVLICLPPGYNLGHVHLGKGSLWGLPELNLERTNRFGVTYRTVMQGVFTEIERCIRFGTEFDLAWNLPGLDLSGYREVIHVREDGNVEQDGTAGHYLFSAARTPPRPPGTPPQLTVRATPETGVAPLRVTAEAEVMERDAPVFYTVRRNRTGVYENAVVLWELFGPRAEDYRFLSGESNALRVQHESNRHAVSITFPLSRVGQYRLRAAVVDQSGRATVIWTPLVVR